MIGNGYISEMIDFLFKHSYDRSNIYFIILIFSVTYAQPLLFFVIIEKMLIVF